MGNLENHLHSSRYVQLNYWSPPQQRLNINRCKEKFLLKQFHMISSPQRYSIYIFYFPYHETVFFLPIHFSSPVYSTLSSHSILHPHPNRTLISSSCSMPHSGADLGYFASCLWQWCHHLTSYSRSGKYIYICTHHSYLAHDRHW